jgi:hypothetical protein
MSLPLRRAGPLNILGLWAFFSRNYLEDDFLALVQGLEALSQDSRVVDKHILASLLSNEPKALLIVPPFDFTFSHKPSPESFEGASNCAKRLAGNRHLSEPLLELRKPQIRGQVRRFWRRGQAFSKLIGLGLTRSWVL